MLATERSGLAGHNVGLAPALASAPAERGRADPGSIFFPPDRIVTAAESAAIVERVPDSVRDALRKLAPPATRAAAVRALAGTIDFTQLPLARE